MERKREREHDRKQEKERKSEKETRPERASKQEYPRYPSDAVVSRLLLFVAFVLRVVVRCLPFVAFGGRFSRSAVSGSSAVGIS